MDINGIVGIAGVLVGMALSYVSFLKKRSRDDEEEGTKNGVMLTEIGYIKAGIDDIKAEQRVQKKSIDELSARVVRVEESTKQAHKRIDGMEGRCEYE